MRGIWRTALGRASVGVIVAGPVGIVTSLATGIRLVIMTGLMLVVGGMVGALTADDAEPQDAAVDAILPIGAWLVGAAVGWVLLATFRDELPQFVERYPSHSALAAGVLMGTLSVVVLMVRLGRQAD